MVRGRDNWAAKHTYSHSQICMTIQNVYIYFHTYVRRHVPFGERITYSESVVSGSVCTYHLVSASRTVRQ